MKKFDNLFSRLILESSEIKTLYLPSEVKHFNFKSFKPFSYKNVAIFQSALHEDINHVLERLNERSKHKYSLDDIFIIIKRGIDEFLQTAKVTNYKNKQSFNIISKTYSDIKIACAIEKNLIKNELFYLNDSDDDPLYHNDYFCFIYTILSRSMRKHLNDKELVVEHSENEITLFVE